MDSQSYNMNGSQQSGPGSDSKQAQVRALQQDDRYKSFLRPEHFTLANFGGIGLDQAQLDTYKEGVKKLWEILVDKSEGSKDYETAKTRLAEMTTKLSRTVHNKNNEDNKKQAQRQSAQSQGQGSNMAQPNAQLSTNQSQTQSQPTSQPMSQSNSSTNADMLIQEQVKKEVEKQQWTLPANMADGSLEAQKWLAEVTSRYTKALLGIKKAELAMNNLKYWMKQQQQAPGFDQKALEKQVEMRRQAIQKQHAESKAFIDKLMQNQQNNKEQLRGQQQQQQQGQSSSQMPQGNQQAQIANLQTGVNLQNGRPLPGASAHPQMTQRPQQIQGVKPTYNHNGQQPTQNNSNYQQRPPPTQSHDQHQRPNTQQGQSNTPVAFTTQQAIDRARAQSINSPQQQQQHMQQPQQPQGQDSRTTISADPDTRKVSGQPISKSWQPQQPQSVNMGPSRPTLSGANNGPVGPMGQPAIQKPETFLLQGAGDRVLERKKLDELYRQVCGADAGEGDSLDPDVAESMFQLGDEFIDNVVTAACRLAKLRGGSMLEIRDIQLVLERQYNIRIPGFATDEVRTVRKTQPAPAYYQKMNAVQAAKVMGGKTDP